MLAMFICVKMNAQRNETTPAVEFDRFHTDSEILSKMTSNSHQNYSRNIIKRQIRKESRTDMESATFEASMKVVAIAV